MFPNRSPEAVQSSFLNVYSMKVTIDMKISRAVNVYGVKNILVQVC